MLRWGDGREFAADLETSWDAEAGRDVGDAHVIGVPNMMQTVDPAWGGWGKRLHEERYATADIYRQTNRYEAVR